MKAVELNGLDLGKTLAVAGQQIAAAGVLAGVHHEADLVSERQVGDVQETYSIGRTHVALTFSNGSVVRVEPGAEVEMQD